MAMRNIARVVLSLSVLLALAFRGEARELIAGGGSAYTILLDESASPSEKTAAETLQSNIQACTGVELPVIATRPEGGSPVVAVGSGAARQVGVAIDLEALGEQGYRLKTSGADIVVAGSPEVGTLYGVYDFLEEFFDVRWFAPDITRLPEFAKVSIPDLDRTVRPVFAYRHTGQPWSKERGPFRPYVRDNSGRGGPDHSHGTQYHFDGTCHTYFRYIDPKGYFESHPEYFSEIGGERRAEEAQLCLTNPEVLDIVTEKMLARMAEAPGTRQHNFSQMDWYNYCECADCTAMYQKHGTTGATQFWFVNQLAERTSKVYPDKLIGTLAYTYTEEPPKGMAMHPNVAVWLCHMFPSCDSHPIATCPLDADYKRRAETWATLCDHLYIWHYTVDYAHYYAPFPNFRALPADIRFYRDIGVEGMYLQSGTRGGDFNLLRPYYGMNLLWNPDQDAEALLIDGLKGFYGAAWEPMLAYINLIHDKVENENIHMHLYTNPAQGFLPDGLLRRADQIFDAAEAAVADDPVVLERVRVERMALTYARLFPRNGYTIEGGYLIVQGDVASVADAEAFIARMRAQGSTAIREWGGDPKQLYEWAAFLNNPVPVERIENDHLLVDIVPAFGGRALRIIDRQTAECVTAWNKTSHLYFPFAGGEETRLGTAFQTPANSLARYTMVSRTGDSVVMEGTALGFAVKRTLRLLPGEPTLHVETDVTNTGDKSRLLIVRGHLELELGTLAETRASFTTRSGQRVHREMGPIIDALREGERFLDQDAPDGAWSFTGSKGLQVTQRFDANAVDFAWLSAFPADLNELELELWRKPQDLQPGETARFTNAIDVRPVDR